MLLEVYNPKMRVQKNAIAYLVGERFAREFSIGQVCVSVQSPHVSRKQVQRSAKPLSIQFEFPFGASAIILVIDVLYHSISMRVRRYELHVYLVACRVLS